MSASQTNHFLRDKLQRKLKFDATSSVRATAAHGSQMGSGISSVGTYFFLKLQPHMTRAVEMQQWGRGAMLRYLITDAYTN